MENHKSNTQKLEVRPLPANFGPLRNANTTQRIKGPYGVTMEMWLGIDEHHIQQATYVKDGCLKSHACGAMTKWIAESKSLKEALNLTPEETFKAAGEMIEEHCTLLVVNTFRAAMDTCQKQQKITGNRNLNMKFSHKSHLISKILKLKYEISNTGIE